tara:strand:+ start:3395 stop:3724 length:330 start_codon:yes stop_codon:yes gene_type:complete
MTWWTKTKNFVIKYWQLLVASVIAIVFYILGRSKDTKRQEVELAEKKAELEKQKTKKVLEGWQEKNKERHDSMVKNILDFEEKKEKILKDANQINTEDYLKSKGIKREE